MPEEKVAALSDKFVASVKALMQDKIHDYWEAWRNMSQESFMDPILIKLQRIRQILLNEGKTILSQSFDANYLNIMNYGVFPLILMNKKQWS